MKNLEELSKDIHSITRSKGFWDSFTEYDTFPFYAYKLAMIHSEVTETLEAIRKDKGEDEVVLEIVDILIRVLDFYEGLKYTKEIDSKWDLDEMMAKKIEVNEERPEMHGVRG
jgi:NTP pyrophosphatase (non-canonical NTP hydrolase)